MCWIANICYFVAGVLYLPVLCYQMVVQGKNRRGWSERFGRIAPRHGDRPAIWIHAVSLGEVNATRRFVEHLQSALGDIDVVLSTTTDTGYARARQLYPDLMVFRYPLDFSWIVERVLARIRPSVIVLMELEVWYNLVTISSRRGVKVCVANGRFTRRSAGRLRLLGPLVRPMFSALSWVGAQTEPIAERFRRAGVAPQRVELLGSMKWDTATVSSAVDGAPALARAMGIRSDRPLVVLGSSGPGEERVVLEACSRLLGDGTQLAVVPRKPERFDDVARLLRKLGHPCVRRSERPDGCPALPDSAQTTVLLGDTMGELRKFYCLCDVAVVGRTFVPLGGSDPMEAAALGKPILVGPHAHNFAEPVADLRQAGALLIAAPGEELQQCLQSLLSDCSRRERMGQQGQEVVRLSQGASAATAQRVRDLLGGALRPQNALSAVV